MPGLSLCAAVVTATSILYQSGCPVADDRSATWRHGATASRPEPRRERNTTPRPIRFHTYECDSRGRRRHRRRAGRALGGIPPAAPGFRAGHARRGRARDVRRARRRRGPGRRVAAPLGVAAHGDRERHPRAAGVPRAAGGSAVGQPRRAAALLRRVRAALRARRAAAGARARHPPCRRRTRRAPARRDRPGNVGSSSRHQCDGNVDPSVPPVLPRTRAFPRSPVARRRLRVGRRVRRQARRHRRAPASRQCNCSTRSRASPTRSG